MVRDGALRFLTMRDIVPSSSWEEPGSGVSKDGTA